ncbi:MAG: hypothetical protein RL660_2636 [Bacteroidota bacterium]|jgi:SAM-dependent methyltransferase
MATLRTKYQGLRNVLLFNWPYYIFASVFVAVLFLAGSQLQPPLQEACYTLAILAFASTSASIISTHIIYDRSSLYALKHLPSLKDKKVLSLCAGFDEIDGLLRIKYEGIQLTTCDFFDSNRHTEPSIARARQLYPSNAQLVDLDQLPFAKEQFDFCIAFLSFHEIRTHQERVQALTNIKHVLNATGNLLITEHLRNIPNFLAYNIGFFHFHGKSTWEAAFKEAGFDVVSTSYTTPFIINFTLK